MIFFDKTRTIGQDANGKNVVWVSVYVDTAANLPAYNDYQSDGFILCMASEGRCIDTGDLYRLDSSGTWQISQAGTGTYTKAEIDALLNAKQDVLTFDATPTQNSTKPVTSGGIWTDQQRQETEIGVVANAGAKNLIPINNLTTMEDSACSWTVNADSSITVTPKSAPLSADWIKFVVNNFVLPAGTYIMSGGIAETSTSNKCDTYIANIDVDPAVTIARGWTDGYQTFTIMQPTHIRFAIRIKTSYNSRTPVTFKPMIRSAAITDPTFQPYAKTNRELTVLTDEGRAALVEIVDGGAKNVRNITLDELKTLGGNAEFSWSGNVATKSNVSFTINTDGTIIVDAAQAASEQVILDIYRMPSDATNMVLSGTPAGGAADTFFQYIKGTTFRDYGEGVLYSKTGAHSIGLVIAQGYRPQNLTFKSMICTETAWKISKAYQQYRPSWQEMYEMILALQ